MEDDLPTPQLVAAIPPLPYTYDEEDSRVVDILNQVSEFCGKEFTEVPPNPDGEKNPETGELEGGDIMPLDDTPEEDNDKNKDGIPDVEDPGSPAEPYPEGPSEELDKLREAYKLALEKNAEEKASYWAILWQVIRLISNMGCWTESHDDTFIVQQRRQVFHAKQAYGCCKKCCNCDEDNVIIPIEYAPLEKHPDPDKNTWEQELDNQPFIGGVISIVINGVRQETKIEAEYLNQHYDPYAQKLYITRDEFPEVLYSSRVDCCCLCERDLTIIVFYNAGYYRVPQALLPLICQLMGKIEDSKKPLSDCTAALTQVSGLLKSMKNGNIQYTWTDGDNGLENTQNLFAEIYNIASMAELFSISRCNIINYESAGEVI